MKRNLTTRAAAVILPLLLLLGCFALQTGAAPPDDETPRNLHIHKFLVENITAFTGNEGDGTQVDLSTQIGNGTLAPLSGIKFAVVKVYTDAEKATYIGGGGSTGEFAACEGASGYWYLLADAANGANQVTTNGSGEATKHFANDGSKDGEYYVIELPDSRVARPIDPFIISVPLSNPASADETDEWLYDIYVYPKNGQLEIIKSFANGDPTEQSFSVGDTITWKITVDIPYGIGSTTQFEVSDTLNSVFSYVGNVYVELDDETEIEDTDYSVVFSSPTLAIDFAKGKATLAAHEGKKLVITFDTTLNATATAGSAKNGAALQYNGTALLASPVGSNPTAYYYAIDIDKFDGRNTATKLGGAKFQLASSEANALAKDFLRRDANGNILDVTDSGYGTAFEWELTTDGSGAAGFSGLAEGTYYLFETTPPSGYNPLSGPVEVEVTKAKAPSGIVTTGIANYTGFTLPFTGGEGVVMFSVIGIALMGVALVLFLVSKRRKAQRATMYLT